MQVFLLSRVVRQNTNCADYYENTQVEIPSPVGIFTSIEGAHKAMSAQEPEMKWLSNTLSSTRVEWTEYGDDQVQYWFTVQEFNLQG